MVFLRAAYLIEQGLGCRNINDEGNRLQPTIEDLLELVSFEFLTNSLESSRFEFVTRKAARFCLLDAYSNTVLASKFARHSPSGFFKLKRVREFDLD